MNIPEPVVCDDKAEPPLKRQRLDTTAQAEEKIYQAPAALSTRPVASPVLPSNSAQVAAPTAETKLYIYCMSVSFRHGTKERANRV